ncbi:hypothetical protein [Isoalcanivorax pacificus]|uniref:hypothetical protein n=1 Tax=Isoalcanivorax pacificus TaxID=1306787 RepID=UPI0011864D3E|nr:hypothetical protein [Isoalcanivorax pacificus]
MMKMSINRTLLVLLLLVSTSLILFREIWQGTNKGASFDSGQSENYVVHDQEVGRQLGRRTDSVEEGVVSPPSQETPVPERKEARYDFSAIALFETHDKAIASAVVLIDGYGAYRYGIGQNVIDEYYIRDIQPDHVIIRGNEGDFKVYLAPLSGQDAQEPSVADSGARGGDILDDTKDRRERMRIFSTYDIYPVSEDSAAGYVIGERFSPEMLEATGAKPGDIIVSVNGYNVGAKEGDDLALKSFRTTMKASVQLRRSDGTTFYFNYPEDADDP